MLLHMNAGIPSYNDTVIHQLTVNEPDWDITPWDYLVRSHPQLYLAVRIVQTLQP